MRILYTIKDMVEEELKSISKKPELTEVDVDNIYKLIDICKDITTIEAMEHKDHNGYSYDEYPEQYDRYDKKYNSEHTRDKLERMMRNAGTEQERESIRRVLEQL